MLFELRDKVTKLESELAELKAENLLRDEFDICILEEFIELEESHRMLKANVAMLTIYGEMLYMMLLDHLNPPPVSKPNPKRDT